MRMHWHPSLPHWLFQPERQRKYSSTAMTCSVQSLPLKTTRLQSDTFKAKKFLRPQQVRNLRIGDSNSSILSYMAYCQMIQRRQLQSREKRPDYTTTRSRELCIADRIMESYSAAFHTKRHKKPLRKLMMVCAELINPDQKLGTDSKNLATSGQSWFLTLSFMLTGVTPVRLMVTSSIKHQVISIQCFLPGHLRCGAWM